ncbi:MAG TPA: hypothetical protein VN578_11560 [Candidatus Binatia bacterium]|nr:hypothetical protein [Candidatus Binatia bacterium]
MNKRNIIRIVCLAGCVAAWPVIGRDKPEKGGPGHKWESEGRQEHKSLDADKREEPRQERRGERRGAFTDEERQTIQGYAQRYNALPGKHERRLPPGLAKKLARGGRLAPGWEKKCVVGQAVPAEVYAECHPLPSELVVKLPPPPEPALTVTVAVEGKVLRLLKATHEILDVFDVQVKL